MGFEQAVGEIPTRIQQLAMIKRLQDSWLKQPFYKYYMNEDLRKPKMAYANALNKSRAQFCGNMLLFSLLFSPLLIITRRFFIYGNPGIPSYLKPNYFDKIRSSLDVRYKNYTLFSFTLWAGLSVSGAYLTTDFYSTVGDQGFRYAAKVQKML